MKTNGAGSRSLGFWDIAALVVAGLLYLDVLAFLFLAVTGVGILLVNALEVGLVAAVLLVLGIGAYILGKRRGLGKVPRRVLLGALVAAGVLLLLFAAAVVGLVIYTAAYTADL